MKKEDYPLQDRLEMMMLPISDRTLTWGEELMLADNFNQPLIGEEEIAPFMSRTYPFKVMFTMIQLCTEGYMRFRYNLQEYVIRAGTAIIIQPNSFGECLEVSQDFRVAYITYKDDSCFGEKSSSFLTQFRNRLTRQTLIPLSPAGMEELLEVYRMMRKKMLEPYSDFTREALIGYLQVMLADCYQALSAVLELEVNEGISRHQLLFDRFLHLLQRHYADERSISFYAGKLCITPKYFSQVIYQASGRHAGEWIKDYVILEAKVLLKSGKYTIQQISDRLNFPNASFFGKYFKASVGCSPRSYQKGG